jgi:Fic family protein
MAERFTRKAPKLSDQNIGQIRLCDMLSLDVPKPFVRSTAGRGMRRTIEDQNSRQEHFPLRYLPEDTAIEHLKFALRYEPLDMGVLAAAFKAIPQADIEAWVKAEPTGTLPRRAWFLYETLLQKKLDTPDAGLVSYVDAIDPELHITSQGKKSRRHKVTDNLIGVPGFCLTVRRTAKLQARMFENLDQIAKSYIADIPPEILARAVHYLYTKETKSSFEIEHENPTPEKARRFITALERTNDFDPTEVKNLVELQNAIVDPKYANAGLRDFQNFVGETLGSHREKVHFICPKPEDVESLIADWMALTSRLKSDADPVTAAAMIAFTFVFIHPFDDGNGRIHRFLIQHVLSSEHYTPEGVIFPVSAAILRNMKEYNSVLESFSKPTMSHVKYRMTPSSEVEVLNDTAHLYRYFDATRLAEFLYDKLAETIETDLRQEVDFVERFDRAYTAVTNEVDMPNRRASLFVRLCMQNAGTLSKKKRELFPELSDDEISSLEKAMQEALEDTSQPTGQMTP